LVWSRSQAAFHCKHNAFAWVDSSCNRLVAFPVNDVFKALADPSRRALLDQLHRHNGQTLNELCRHLAISRQGITKHLGILIKANLVVPLWRGREKLHYLNPAPLKQVSERWIDKHKSACSRALADLTEGLNALGADR
jgi:DNA-binding transcriptional ArsR family regulator